MAPKLPQGCLELTMTQNNQDLTETRSGVMTPLRKNSMIRGINPVLKMTGDREPLNERTEGGGPAPIAKGRKRRLRMTERDTLAGGDEILVSVK